MKNFTRFNYYYCGKNAFGYHSYWIDIFIDKCTHWEYELVMEVFGSNKQIVSIIAWAFTFILNLSLRMRFIYIKFRWV